MSYELVEFNILKNFLLSIMWTFLFVLEHYLKCDTTTFVRWIVCLWRFIFLNSRCVHSTILRRLSSERAQWVIRSSMLFTKGFKLHLIKLTTYDLFKLKSSRFSSFSLKMSHLFKIHSLFSKNKTYVYRDESSSKYRSFLRSFDMSRTNPSISILKSY